MRQTQPLPTTGATDAKVLLARQLGRLLGPWLDAPDGSRNAADLVALGSAIGDAGDSVASAGDEAFVYLASALIEEWEALYGITTPAPTLEERRADLLARARAGFVAHPRTMVAAIRTIAGDDATVVEPLWSEVTVDPERVHVIAVRMSVDAYGTPPEHTDTYLRVGAVVQRMKPAHVDVVYTGTQTAGFYTDDPNSLTDNTILRT